MHSECYLSGSRFEYDFDDSDWPAAVEYGRNGDSPVPWKRVIPGIDEEARWIWTSEQKDDDIIYCRFVAGKFCTSCMQ